MSLADALALGTCARNVVLLGDPQQLGQVSQGIHPEGAAASVLEHLLGGEDTVPPDRGLFLSRTWRMHPDVCRFISETSYEGRLHSVPACAAAADRLARPRGDGAALAAGRARGEPRLVDRGGRPDRRRARAADRRDVHRPRRARAPPRLGRRARRDAVQRAGALPAQAARPARADRHGRQVPGAGGAGRLLLDGDVERRRPAAQPRVPVLAQPPERRDLARAVAGGAGREPEAARDPLPHDRADADGERALPVRGGSSG